jgi:dTDP-4-dehydrorhamnose 3,5-epimerase
MRFRPTGIEGFVIVETDVRTDSRGAFCRTFCEREFTEAGISFRVAQANLSLNPHVHTLRGMHYQEAPHAEPKIVSCLAGRVFDVAVDLRPNSPTYRRWEAVELAPALGRMVYLDEGLAHGFLTLEPHTDVHYLMGAPYVPNAARGLRWDDTAIGIAWPAVPVVISDRDQAYPGIDDREADAGR